MAERARNTSYEAFGDYIRSQRKLAQLTLRQAAELARISNPYLSQIEHGLALPSITVLNGSRGRAPRLHRTLLLRAAGAPTGDATARSATTEDAIRHDARLDDAQKQALLAVLAAFVLGPSSRDPAPGACSQGRTFRTTNTPSASTADGFTTTKASSVTMPDMRFDGRVAIITGAGGGLGRSHALELARRGAHILVNDLGGALDGSGSSTPAAQRVVDEITELGGKAAANDDTVATAEGGEAIVQAALDAFGRVDVLVNNAGILRDKAFHKMDHTMIDPVIDVHLKGAFYVSQPAFRLMREQGYGRIINTSSASGLFGNFGQANYGAAKAGLAGLTRVLAIEGAKPRHQGQRDRADCVDPDDRGHPRRPRVQSLARVREPASCLPGTRTVLRQRAHLLRCGRPHSADLRCRDSGRRTSGEHPRSHPCQPFAIHQRDVQGHHAHEPSSLEYETTIIAEALSDAS